METVLIIVAGIAITFAVVYLFISFKNSENEYEHDDFRDNNNFEDTARDFRPSYNDNYNYSSYDDETSFSGLNILLWIVIAAIMVFSFWAEYEDDDDYYDDGYRRSSHYGVVYYGSSGRYSGGYSTGGLRRSGSSFRGRSYGGGGK